MRNRMFIAHAQHCAHYRLTVYSLCCSGLNYNQTCVSVTGYACVRIVWYKDFEDSRKLEIATFALNTLYY